jgi:hypothetical protein
MLRLSLLLVLAVALSACGGGSAGSRDAVKITLGRSGGTMVPYSITIAPGGNVSTTGNPPATPKSLSSAKDAEVSGHVRSSLPNLQSEQCSGTFADESEMFITALGKTVTVRGGCEPGFTLLWGELTSALGLPS